MYRLATFLLIWLYLLILYETHGCIQPFYFIRNISMDITQFQYATFITDYLNTLADINGKIKVTGIHPITINNWRNPKRPAEPSPNMYSLHKLAANTGRVFYVRSDRIWDEKTQPTYCPVSENVVISQRIEECTHAFERWPGKSPPNYIKMNIPNFSTIAKIVNHFAQVTFICDHQGIRFEGWDNYPVLQHYSRSFQIPNEAADCGRYSETQNMPVNPLANLDINIYGVSVTIAATLPCHGTV